MKKGIFYAVSTGPGNAELLTLQAVRILKSCSVILYPETKSGTLALDSLRSLKELDLSQKKLIPCPFTMSGQEDYTPIVRQSKTYLDQGQDVAMLSIGDVSVYSSAAQTTELLKVSGYKSILIAGVTSFCSAAATAGIPLCRKDEKLTIIPADACFQKGILTRELKSGGTKVLMKMGRHLDQIISLLNQEGLLKNSILVQNSSQSDERLYRADEILLHRGSLAEKAYLSLIIIKQE